MKPEDYGYVVKNNLCLFQKGPLSQWWGGFNGQNGGFIVGVYDLYFLYIPPGVDIPQNIKIFQHLDKSPMVENKMVFNCCEQWMMACKAILFNDIESFEKIMKEQSPSKQKDLGRGISNYNQEAWNEYKYNIVLRGNEQKFDQNKELQEFLMSFNSFTIFAEAAPWDKVWGIGLGPDDPKAWDIHTWQGENLLGRVITRLRRIYEDDID